MAITSKTLIPFGQEYGSNKDGFELPPGFYHGATGYSPMVTNKHIIHAEHDRPSDISVYNSRHTAAVDIKFQGGYLNKVNYHFGLMLKHSGMNYVQPGNNRAGAVIAGDWGEIPNKPAIGLEEIEIGPLNNNIHHQTTYVPLLQESRWYRFVLDSIVQGPTTVAHEIRVIDKLAGSLVYNLGTTWSSYGGNYIHNSNKVGLFSIINKSDPTANFRVGNMVSYWSQSGEWVANP